MDTFKGTLKAEKIYGLLKFFFIVSILSAECVAGGFKIHDNNNGKVYALKGNNTVLRYQITGTAGGDPKRIHPNVIRLFVQTGHRRWALLFKFDIDEKGKIIGNITKENSSPGSKLARYNGRAFVKYEGRSVVLSINNISDADFNLTYFVAVFDDTSMAIEAIERKILLIKAIKPVIWNADFFPKSTIIRGKNERFICRADGIPDPWVKWVVQKSQKVRTRSMKMAELKIDNAMPSHVNDYTCIAGNIGGTVSKTMSLIVAYIEYKHKTSSKHTFVENGGKIEAECDVDGYPPPEYKWMTPKNIVIRTNKMLVIGNVRPAEVGNYTCEAINKAGTLNYTVQVEVKEVQMEESMKGTSSPTGSIASHLDECILLYLLSTLLTLLTGYLVT